MNDANDRRLIDAWQTGGDEARPRDDCPPADRIWAAARGELPLDDRLAVLDHVSECPVCAEAWRLAREIDVPGEPRAIDTLRHRGLPGWVWPAAAAAVVVLAVAAAVLWPPPPDPGEREPNADVLKPITQEGESLPRDAFVLRWTAGPPGSVYDVSVTTADLQQPVAAGQGLRGTEYLVPPERLAGLPSGTRLRWGVTGRTPDARRLQSPTMTAIVR